MTTTAREQQQPAVPAGAPRRTGLRARLAAVLRLVRSAHEERVPF
ncbi:hypothetical protein [Nocardioides sp. GY 10113]|nr:hypothetical protein [Nocardioides sp. GY 10113]